MAPGAAQQSFTFTENGAYAVVVTDSSGIQRVSVSPVCLYILGFFKTL